MTVLGVLTAALAVGVFAVAPTIGSAAESEPTAAEPAGALEEGQGCEANNVCGYTAVGFEGQKFSYPCSASGSFEAPANMIGARNRCGNKSMRLGNGICLNAGEQQRNTGSTFGVIILPAAYGNTC
jgi:hypothetical protein